MPVQKMCYLGCQIVVRHLGWLQNPTLLINRERESRRIRGKLRPFIYLGIIFFLGQNYSKIQLSKSNMKILTAQKNNQKQVTSVKRKKGKKTRTLLQLYHKQANTNLPAIAYKVSNSSSSNNIVMVYILTDIIR